MLCYCFTSVCVCLSLSARGCCICFFFFFFKQKTAYEMRISDWSSDVCSSDLINGTIPAPLIRLREGQNVRLIVENTLDEDTSIHWHGLIEIGRASCRERVCQYV